MKENIYYYVTHRNGVKVRYDDLRLKTIVDDVNNFLKRTRDFNHQVKHFFDEEEADQFFRAYKKTLEKEEALIEVVPLKKENVERVVKQSVPELKTESNKMVNQEISKIELKEHKTSDNIDILDDKQALQSVAIDQLESISEWGGKRKGAGAKKGYQQSQDHRNRRIAALRESAQRRREMRNAVKPVNE